MKLVLASQGFTTPEIAGAVSELVGKPLEHINVAIINEAYVGISAGRDERWLINELSQISQYIKGAISFVNLRAYDIEEIAKRLEFADLIYIVGGAQVVLPKLFKQTGFDTLLAELATTKVIMGTSAGANVIGKHIEDANYWDNQYGEAAAYLAIPFLGLADFNILPHFERQDHPHRNREQLTPLLRNHPFPLYGVTDTQAVIFNNDSTEFVGGDIPVFGKVS
jgi:peptidase E